MPGAFAHMIAAEKARTIPENNDIHTIDDMAWMATVVRTTMSIIKGKYYDSVMPEEISEQDIIKICFI